MNTLSASEAKMKLSALVDLVESTGEEVLIARNGRPVAVFYGNFIQKSGAISEEALR